MMSSSSRLPSKIFLFILIAVFIIASFNLPSIFKSQFLEIKTIIEKKASVVLDKDVQIESVGFLPYGKVILKNIKIEDVEIERLDARFNILKFLINKFILKEQKDVHLTGLLIFKRPDFIDPIKYKLDAFIIEDFISINSLAVDSRKFDIDISGSIKDYLKKPQADLNIISREINFPGVPRINNLYGQVNFSKESLVVKDLDFFVNNFPVGIKCKISDFISPDIVFDIMSYPGQLPSLRPFNPFNFKLSFSGTKSAHSIKGDMVLETEKLVLLNPRKTSYSRLKLNGLTCNFLNRSVSMNTREIACETDFFGRSTRFEASDFNALLYAGKTKIYIPRSNLPMYEGIMKASGFIDLHKEPPKLFLDFKLEKIDIPELVKALDLNYELKGTLDFKGIFNSALEPCLTGRINVSEGYIKDIQLLLLLSDFLSVPSLKNMYFENISSIAAFSCTGREFIFNKATVTGDDINLKGDFRLKTTKKINGNMSVRLSTALLKESFKLRLLFFIIGERLPYQDFEFEIGGFLNSLQIKWLSTRFRENVMRYLSEAGQKNLEKSLEQAMEQLAK